MASLDIQHTPVFTWNYDAISNEQLRFIINQGGSRSSKTYSICQLLIVFALTNPGITISVVRKTFPALRSSVMRDFFGIMEALNIYKDSCHNKTENIYKFDNGSIVEFFSVDDAQKLRGRKRDVVFANEANELSFEEFQQLNMRTSKKFILDFNPSDNYSWIYDLKNKDNAILIKSTYKDNPFLESTIIKEIENLINIDEGYYRIYALGEQAILKSTIYSNYDVGEYISKDIYYGLDIGYNHPMALVEISVYDGQIYCKELIYESGMTVKDLVDRMVALNINKKSEILVDSARPDVIEDLRRGGYNAKPARKEVTEGINSVKSYKLVIDKQSPNLLKEIRNYKWKTNGDLVLDEPVKMYDDAMDALRYAIHYYHQRNKKGKTDFSISYFDFE